MGDLQDPDAFDRLRQLLAEADYFDNGRAAVQEILSPEFERAVLSQKRPARDRLAGLAQLAVQLEDTRISPRERSTLTTELNRFALRVLWWEGLLGPGIVPEAPPHQAAVALIELLAGGLLPSGPAGIMVLDRAKDLLRRAEVVGALRVDVPRRDLLVARLFEAERRIRAQAEREEPEDTEDRFFIA